MPKNVKNSVFLDPPVDPPFLCTFSILAIFGQFNKGKKAQKGPKRGVFLGPCLTPKNTKKTRFLRFFVKFWDPL